MPISITMRAQWSDLRIIAQSGRSLSEDRSRQWQRRESATEARGGLFAHCLLERSLDA